MPRTHRPRTQNDPPIFSPCFLAYTGMIGLLAAGLGLFIYLRASADYSTDSKNTDKTTDSNARYLGIVLMAVGGALGSSAVGTGIISFFTRNCAKNQTSPDESSRLTITDARTPRASLTSAV